MTYGLGRLPQFDERSRGYPIRALLDPVYKPRGYTWSCPVTLDQGSDGACVGFAWTQEIAARPGKWDVSEYMARLIYREAQKIDEWPGEAYEGTSVLAGVKVATSLGHYREYRWAFSLEDMILAIGYHGPVVIGVNWYSGMFDPDADGLLHPTGTVAGGHALVVNGVSVKRELFRVHNSWGPDWGINGEAFISFADLDRLRLEGGEVCVPVLRRGA